MIIPMKLRIRSLLDIKFGLLVHHSSQVNLPEVCKYSLHFVSHPMKIVASYFCPSWSKIIRQWRLSWASSKYFPLDQSSKRHLLRHFHQPAMSGLLAYPPGLRRPCVERHLGTKNGPLLGIHWRKGSTKRLVEANRTTQKH